MDTELRRIVRERAGNRCEYYGLQQEHAPLVLYTVDHVLPKKHGGGNDESNLAFACYRCNLHKGPNLAGIDPESSEMVSLFNPRQQSWLEHFARIGSLIVGVTPIGRATVQVLAMNAPERRELRERLIDSGELE